MKEEFNMESEESPTEKSEWIRQDINKMRKLLNRGPEVELKHDTNENLKVNWITGCLSLTIFNLEEIKSQDLRNQIESKAMELKNRVREKRRGEKIDKLVNETKDLLNQVIEYFEDTYNL